MSNAEYVWVKLTVSDGTEVYLCCRPSKLIYNSCWNALCSCWRIFYM